MVDIPNAGILVLAIILIAAGVVLSYVPLPAPTPVGTLSQILIYAGIIVFVIWIIAIVWHAVKQI